MIRGFKRVSEAAAFIAIAACAFGAMPAFADVVTAESTPLTLTGSQQGIDIINVDGGEVRCNPIISKVKYTGSISSSPASTLTLSPTYSGCTFVGLAASIQLNGCAYLVHVGTTAGVTSTGTLDVVCPEGKEITVTAPTIGTAKCTIHIPGQTGLEFVSVGNVGAGATRELTVNFTIGSGVKRLQYSQTAGTAETGNCATADNTTTGTFTASLLLTAEDNKFFHTGIFASS